jgi:alpha-L-fucosidase 2
MARRLDQALKKMDRGLRVGKWGQLQEWRADLDDPRDDHRHVSHLFALHPGRAIQSGDQDEFRTAAAKTLDARGDASTGWSRAWKINFWARLLDGNRAHKLLAGLLRDSTLPNLWDTHPPFQIDGNFGATAGMVEMLLQSHAGEVRILPARPEAWATGSVSGLRARGDITVSIDWDTCGAKRFTLEAGRDGPLRVHSPMFAKAHELNVDEGSTPGNVQPDHSYLTLPARKGMRYTFTRGANACEAH